jgi:hypothetical protein
VCTEVTARTGAVGGPGAGPSAGAGTGMHARRRADMTAYARYKREVLGSLSGTVLEIGAASRGLQRCCAPLSGRLAAGCDPARETWRAIAAAGFRDVQFRRFSPRPVFGLYSYYLGGTAHA